jgi:hypothetical protein
MRTLSLLLIAVMLAAARPSAAFAYLDWFESRTVASANGEYLLVLLTPPAERVGRTEYDPTVDKGLAEEEIRAWKESLARQRALEAKYPRSGIYRNDGSTEPVWPMPYITVCKNIYVANNGAHVIVAYLDWEADNVSSRGDALEFYARGEQIGVYNEDDIVPAFFAKTIANRCLGREALTCREASLDDDAQIFTLVTTQGESFRYDVTTGKALQRCPWGTLSLGILIVAVSLVLWRRSRRHLILVRTR